MALPLHRDKVAKLSTVHQTTQCWVASRYRECEPSSETQIPAGGVWAEAEGGLCEAGCDMCIESKQHGLDTGKKIPSMSSFRSCHFVTAPNQKST